MLQLYPKFLFNLVFLPYLVQNKAFNAAHISSGRKNQTMKAGKKKIWRVVEMSSRIWRTDKENVHFNLFRWIKIKVSNMTIEISLNRQVCLHGLWQMYLWSCSVAAIAWQGQQGLAHVTLVWVVFRFICTESIWLCVWLFIHYSKEI